MSRRWLSRVLGPLALLVLFASGCASQTETVSPPVAAPDSFAEAGRTPVADRWWTAFENEQLNAAVDSALAANFGLRSTWQRLKAAQAVVDRESAVLFPSLEGSAQGQVTERSDETTDRGTENLSLGLTTVYEIDLWGRLRSRVDAERFRAAATRADYQTAALSLSAEIVRTWARLAEARSQVALVNEQVQTNQNVLELLEARFQTGQIQSVDILRQRQLVEATREQRALEESRVEVLTHQLAVLQGRPPQTDLPARPDTLLTLPPLPDPGVPTTLVRRRPDVQSAFHRLRAADRDLAAAISDQYPRLTLSASASTAAESAENLFENWAAAFAGDLLAPIFFGGELRAEVDRAEAVRTERLYTYGQTILTAFQEVEDALIQEQKQRASIQRLQAQIDLSQQAYEQLRVQYLNGTANYLDVLTALDDLQQLRRDRLAAQLTLVETRVALYRALAGSFDTGRGAE